jgi:hypothetical protein
MKRLGLSLAIGALVVGCFSPSFVDGKDPCSTDGDCPPGRHCAADHTCWHAGRDPDLGDTPPDFGGQIDGAVDGPAEGGVDLAPITFPPAAVWISSGGGSLAAGAEQLNLCIGAIDSVGSVNASSGVEMISGFFATDTD